MSKFINKQSSTIRIRSHKHLEISINNNIEMLNSVITTELGFCKNDEYVNNNSKLINSVINYFLICNNETVFVYNSKIHRSSNFRWVFGPENIPSMLFLSVDEDVIRVKLLHTKHTKLNEKLRAI